jgi:methylenetetrahydrofolate--tRNA-(uracil-5-)-methyltransferase
MLGALYRYVHTADPEHFQPMNANFGLLEPLARVVKDKQKKREFLVERALRDIAVFAQDIGVAVTA